MSLSTVSPGWLAVFRYSFADREAYGVEPVVAWIEGRESTVYPVSMASIDGSLLRPTMSEIRRFKTSLAERCLGCLMESAPWPFDSPDPRQAVPDHAGARCVVVAKGERPSDETFELEL